MADVVPSLLIVALVKLRKKLAAPDGSQTSGRLVEGAREQRLHAASAERRPLDQTAHARSWTSANGASESAARKESSVVVVCLDSINLASRLVAFVPSATTGRRLQAVSGLANLRHRRATATLSSRCSSCPCCRTNAGLSKRRIASRIHIERSKPSLLSRIRGYRSVSDARYSCRTTGRGSRRAIC